MKQLQSQCDRYGLDILAIQEVRWKESNITDFGNYTFFNSASSCRNTHGTGFVIRKEIKSEIIDFRTVNERICILRLRARFFNITLFSVHAPTEDAEEEQKDEFYEKLNSEMLNVPRHDVKIVLGDLNAKIGKEASFRPTIGQFSMHETSNENGVRAVDFATNNNMVISSTCFNHKRIHRETWISPDGKTKNQIDHIIIDKKHASDVLDVRSYRGADCDTDHFLVIMKYRQRISRTRNKKGEKQKKFSVRKLSDKEIKDNYCKTLDEKIENEHLRNIENASIEDRWNSYKNIVINSADEVMGREEGKKNKEWFDEECEILVKEKNEARAKLIAHFTRNNEKAYRQKKKLAKYKIRTKKRTLEKERIQEVEDLSVIGDIRGMYSKLTSIRRGYQPRTTFCRGRNGNLVGKEDELLERWAEYFEGLLNRNDSFGQPEMNLESQEEIDCDPIDLEEVKNAIKKLRNGKAPGEDMICPELLKYGSDNLCKIVFDLMKEIWEKEEMPSEWNSAVICPILKKGNILECSNYRGISLLNLTYKILTKIIANRLKPLIERELGEYQCGFRKNRSTVDQIFCIRNILEKCYEKNINMYQLYIDFKQAYDSINREKMLKVLQEFNIPQKLIRLVKMTITSTKAKVKVQNKLSREFKIVTGLRQGDILSTILFNACLEKAMRNTLSNRGGTIFNRTTQALAFADDVILIARSKNALIELFKKLSREAGVFGLEININKTKYMIMDCKETDTDTELKINEETKFERVTEFKYLGSIITDNNDIMPELKQRLNAGNRSFFALQKLIRSKVITQKTKLLVYKTVIKPTVIYGSETWTLNQKHEKMLITWERKILRTIFGPIREGDIWRKRFNHEIEKLYKGKDIINHIKSKRIQWLGHMERMNDDRCTKKIFKGQCQGQRKRGRPRKRWLDEVEKDLKSLKISNWKTKTKDRQLWSRIVREVMVQHGL